MPGPLLAVDAPYVLYRSFFALPDTITDGEGHPVNALLGSLNLLLLVIAEHAPRAVVLCFGAEAALYRTELYPPYHADRPPMPEGLARQFAAAAALYAAFGWDVLDTEELEADDLLGALAEAEAEAGGTALVLTGDRDMYQLVSEQVSVLYLKSGIKGTDAIDPAGVEQRYGVRPAQVPDFIALRGDPSDGLPGGKGIGAKTAAELLREHGSLDGVLAGALRDRRRAVRALTGAADELRAFKDIATLRPVAVERPADRPTDLAAGAAAARALGLRRLAERLESGG